MKPRQLLLSLLALLVTETNAYADTQISDGIYYGYDKSKNKAWVAGVTDKSYSGHYVIRNSINDCPVIYINPQVFYKSQAKQVDIPNSVGKIYAVAFWQCSLDSITFGNGLTIIEERAFLECPNLRYINIPDSVTSIGQRAFEGCSNLRSINIPDRVTSIENKTFYNCTALKSVTIGESVTSIGNSAFSCCRDLTSINIPNSVDSIYSYAFGGCHSLTPITIPNNVTYIGQNAFANCRSLTSVTIPNSVTEIDVCTFTGCSGLTSVTIGNSVTSIGSEAFYNCSGLKSVTSLATTPPALGTNVFRNISSNCVLTVPKGKYYAYISAGWTEDIFKGGIVEISPDITFADAKVKALCVANWDTNGNGEFGNGELSEAEAAAVTDLGTVFYGNKKISSFNELQYFTGLTSIGEYAFAGCSGLKSVTIPKSVTSTGYGAFQRCENLTSITIPNSVTSIGDYTFYVCESLTSITIPDRVKSIGKSAFQLCTSLPSITIPNSVTSIGEWAFGNCSSLTSIIIPNNVTSIGNWAFAECSGLTTVTIPNSVFSIGINPFCCCSGLTSIEVASGNNQYDSRNNSNAIIETATNTLIAGCKSTIIPEGVTSIGEAAFDGCSGLTSITIPESVTSIGRDAFEGCIGLTSVTIPNNVTSIGRNAFYNCSSLTSVVSKIQEPFAFGEDAFYGISSNCVLTVPAGTRDAYIAAGWTEVIFNGGIVEDGASSEVKGDLNGDGKVSITDVVMIIDVIAGTITDANKRAVADVNGDGNVTITDCVAAIDLIAAQGSAPSQTRRKAHTLLSDTDFITGAMEDGLLTVSLDNEKRYTAFQMIVSVPDGMTLGKATIDKMRAADHQAMVRDLGGGRYLVAGFSFDNEELTGSNGRLLSIVANGQTTDDIVISDIEFATTQAEAYYLADIAISSTIATGINEMKNEELRMKNEIYDLQGRRVMNPTKGLYIVNGKKVNLK